MHKRIAMALIGAGALIPVQAGAETLRVNGVYPANYDLPGEVDVLSVARFDGDAGAEAELAITEILGNVSIEGEQYFRLIPDAGYGYGGQVTVHGYKGEARSISAHDHADATLSGGVFSDVIEQRVQPRIVSRCIERDEKRKCIEWKERRIPCRELTVRMDARIFLTAVDGTRLYSHRAPVSDTVHYCRNDAHIPSEIEMGNRLIEQIAQQVRADLAPVQFSRGYRIMERRKGLSKADRQAFKQAIRLTKSSASDACDAFGNLYQTNPDHISVVYNMGLCAESAGDLDLALSFYEDARQINRKHSYHRKGAGRIAARYRADAQLAARDNARRVRVGLR